MTPLKLLLIATAATIAVPAAAQNSIIVPLPERYELPPGNAIQAPTPTPTPTPTAAAPPPIVRTVPTPTPTTSATATPRATPTPTPWPTPTPSPTPTVAPPVVVPVPNTPDAVPSPTPSPVSVPTPAAIETPTASGPPAWLWWLGGLAVVAGAGIALLLRRRAAAERTAPIAYAPAPSPPAPAPRLARPPAPAPAPEPRRALGLDLRPKRLWTRGPNAYLEFELLVTNTAQAPLGAVRPVIALVSAGSDTAAEVAAFAAGVSSLPGGEPFDLRGGETRVVAGELTLPGDAMAVTEVGGREMIVPVAMVGATWRGGLSVASVVEAFIVGTGDATSAKLGPVWVDRPGQIYGRLDARRFTPR